MKLITEKTDGSRELRNISPVSVYTSAPTSGDGADGDYAYYDGLLYGPKAAGAWPAGVQLKNPVGTADGQLLYWDGASFSPIDIVKMFWDNANGRLGIGIASPQTTLALSTATTTLMRIETTGSGTTGRSLFQMVDTPTSGWEFSNNIAKDGLNKFCITEISGANRYYYMTFLKTSGYIGVNTITPRRRLEILDTTAAQLRRTHTDNSVYVEDFCDSNGDLNVFQTGDETSYQKQSSSAPRTIETVKREYTNAIDASRAVKVTELLTDFAATRPVITKAADGTESLLSFHGATPVGRADHIADATADLADVAGKLNQVLAILENIGMIKTS
jgi:hypothetical protein